MIVETDRVVYFHYEMVDEDGSQLASTRAGEPVAVLQGRGNVMWGIEQALEGRRKGEQFSVTLPPEQAFGRRRDGHTRRVPKKYLDGAARLKKGMVARFHTEDGVRPVTVLKVGHKNVDVDLNHPHAGRSLRFDIEILDVREASPDEIAHKHVHGPGGHAH